MRIRVNHLITGPNGVFQPGEIADLPDNMAMALMAAGRAEALEARPDKKLAETATRTAPEKAVSPASKAKAKG